PSFKGKLAIPDISGTSGQQFLMAAARLNGGSIENIDPGFEAIKKLKPNVQMMYTQPDQIIPLFERGDIAVAVWYTDRTGAAAAKGVPVAASYPKEGAIGVDPSLASASPAVSGAAPALSVRRLRKSFGAVVAVDEVSLDAAPGEFLSLLGPSGCGKSTVLRMVAGLVEPDAGEVVLAGEDIT